MKKIDPDAMSPSLMDWESQQAAYQGWHLLYADQCPWHQKAVDVLMEAAKAHDLDLQVHRIETPDAARNAPSGFGVFSLLYNGKLLADHYISATRFQNILRKELG